jgi:polysaccharide export outer membrane protein
MMMPLLLLALQIAAAPSAPTAPTTPATTPKAYVVGPNDVLTVSVYNQAQLSGKFVVEADGTIGYPLLGRVSAGGLTVRAVEEKIHDGLVNRYLKDPQVTVAVDQFRSQQIFVIGEVKQPGTLQFTGSMTLIEALVRAGSTTEHVGTDVVVIRPSGDASAATAPGAAGSETIKVSLQNLQTGALSQNVTLRAGDTVFVTRAETLFVSGNVRTPGEYVTRPGMTVRQAIALAGGVTDRGSTRRLQIIRVVKGKEVVTSADMQTAVQAGDTIVVQERFF